MEPIQLEIPFDDLDGPTEADFDQGDEDFTDEEPAEILAEIGYFDDDYDPEDSEF